MARTTIEELAAGRIASFSPGERRTLDEMLELTRVAINVGEQVRDARETRA